MRSFIILFSLAILTTSVIPSCTQQQVPMSTKKVTIDITKMHGRKPQVIPPWVHLEYGTDQQVEWGITKNVKFKVKFNKDGTPFKEDNFDNKTYKSGRVEVNPGPEEKFYHYSVEVEGFDPVDPGIIIWRRN